MDRMYEVLMNKKARLTTELFLIRVAQLESLASKDPISMTSAEVMNGKPCFGYFPDFFGYKYELEDLINDIKENFESFDMQDKRRIMSTIRGIWEYHSVDIVENHKTISEAIDEYVSFKKSIDDVDEETKAEVDQMVKEAESECDEEEKEEA